MGPLLRAAAVLALLAGTLVLAAPAAAGAGRPNIAALQVALGARGLYGGTVDGIRGPATLRATRVLQRRAGLLVDGIAGPQTRRALGRYGRHTFATRPLRRGHAGWDVAALQFALAEHGFPSGTFDGGFGPRTETALRRFQRFARLGADGVAGPATFRALRGPVPRAPVSLARPVRAPVTDRFGPRGTRFHTGIDFPAHYGARVRSARAGRVRFAAWNAGGYGYLVIVRHGAGVRTWYAHLSSLAVHRGARVSVGTLLGRVGASGTATGPHLHFELRLRGAAVDPLPALR